MQLAPAHVPASKQDKQDVSYKHENKNAIFCLPLDLGLPATNQNWPEAFGFRLGGTGPSYILSVVEGSSAYLAGLQPGDQVVDIEGQDVTNLSTPALIALAQTLKTVPPSIGVVSRIEQVRRHPVMYILQLKTVRTTLMCQSCFLPLLRLTSILAQMVALASPSLETAP